jgi:hypothetical protein
VERDHAWPVRIAPDARPSATTTAEAMPPS